MTRGAAHAATEPTPAPTSARGAAVISILSHAVILAVAFGVSRLRVPPVQPPAYAVELIAAPPGERSLGATTQGETAAPPTAPVAPPQREEPDAPPVPAPTRKPAPAPRPAAAKAAATVPKAVKPVPGGSTATVAGARPAGGGATGGRGRDVANVRVQGIAFPYPGYLENITRQIALNFRPKGGIGLRAEVSFLIRRDGSVSELRMSQRSGTYAFDLECLGAVEAVGQRRSFGPLPAGFRDDVLPVVFSFDPNVLR